MKTKRLVLRKWTEADAERRGLQGRRLFRTILFERVRGKPTEKTYLVMGV